MGTFRNKPTALRNVPWLPGYEVESNAQVIKVLAIGIKERNKLRIGGEEFEP